MGLVHETTILICKLSVFLSASFGGIIMRIQLKFWSSLGHFEFMWNSFPEELMGPDVHFSQTWEGADIALPW